MNPYYIHRSCERSCIFMEDKKKKSTNGNTISLAQNYYTGTTHSTRLNEQPLWSSIFNKRPLVFPRVHNVYVSAIERAHCVLSGGNALLCTLTVRCTYLGRVGERKKRGGASKEQQGHGKRDHRKL